MEKTLIVKVPEEYHHMVKLKATEQGISIRLFILRSIAHYIQDTDGTGRLHNPLRELEQSDDCK